MTKTVYQQPIPTREQRAEQMRISERETRRRSRRELVGTAAICVAWTLLAYLFFAFSFHTNDEKTGWVLYWTGMSIGAAGNLVTLYLAYRRGQERGDW